MTTEGPYLTLTVAAGLGNQLFIIAAALLIRDAVPGIRLVFSDRDEGKDRPKCWTGFMADCPRIQELLVKELPSAKWERIGDLWDVFIFVNFTSQVRRNFRNGISTQIDGWFQNRQYQPVCRDNLMEIFNMREKHKILRERLSRIDFETACSLHFRLGDYKALARNVFFLLSDDYYREALKIILAKRPDIKKILVFNELEDQHNVENRMSVLAKDLNGCEVEFVSSFGLKDWEELVTMSLCSANIIANSTFSWWGARLNAHQLAPVVYSKTWVATRDSAHWNLAYEGWQGI